MRPEGAVSLGSWCVCRFGNIGSAPRHEWHLGMAFPQKVPSEGETEPVPVEGAGVDFSSAHTSRVQGVSGTPGWGEERALPVGTISEQTESLLLMYLLVSQGW